MFFFSTTSRFNSEKREKKSNNGLSAHTSRSLLGGNQASSIDSRMTFRNVAIRLVHSTPVTK